MSDPVVRYYVAASIDGFIATPDGGVGWLEPFHGEDYGYQGFYARVGVVVMGRRTFDQALGYETWPYAGRRTVVLTTQPLGPDAPAGVEAWDGDAATLVHRLKAETQGEIYMCGGGQAAQAFLDAGCIDRLELYVMPVLLGAGVPLFAGGAPIDMALLDARPMARGVVRLTYGPVPSA